MNKYNILFEGGGFQSFWYEFGYGLKMIQKLGIDNIGKLGGFSCGSLVCSLIILPSITIEEVLKVCSTLYTYCIPGRFSSLVYHMMNQLLPENIHTIAIQHNVEIIACNKNNHYTIFNTWNSKTHYIDTLIASCFIPGISGLSLYDKNTLCKDGGFCMNLHELYIHYDCIVNRPIDFGSVFFFVKSMIAISEYQAKSYFKLGKKNWKKKLNEMKKINTILKM